jgi:hypothetical protein
MPGNDTTCTPGLRSIPGCAVNEAFQPGKQRRTLARALDHQATPRQHLSVTPRWIELQQRRGLPHIHTPGLNRYRISEVETWLREQYGWPHGP